MASFKKRLVSLLRRGVKTMYCGRCQTDLPPHAKFCDFCGAQVHRVSR